MLLQNVQTPLRSERSTTLWKRQHPKQADLLESLVTLSCRDGTSGTQMLASSIHFVSSLKDLPVNL